MKLYLSITLIIYLLDNRSVCSAVQEKSPLFSVVESATWVGSSSDCSPTAYSLLHFIGPLRAMSVA